jgi:hypothetical protein
MTEHDEKVKRLSAAVMDSLKDARWKGTKIVDEEGPAVILRREVVRAGRTLSCQAFRVYAVLKSYANEPRDRDKDGDEVWPGQDRIARDAGMCVRQVQQYLGELKRLGLVEAQRVGLAEKGWGHNLYILKKRLPRQLTRPTA